MGPAAGTDEGEGTTTSDDGDVTSVGSDGEDTGRGGTETGAEDSGTVEPGLCGIADGTRPLAVLSAGTTAMLLRADGSSVGLDLHGQAVPADASTYTTTHAVGSYAAISLSWALLDGGVQHGSEVSVFDDAGALVWHVSEANASVGSVFVDANGSVVATRTFDDGPTEGVAYVGGDGVALPSFVPEGPIRGDGMIPGRYLDGGPGTLGWLRSDDLAFFPVEFYRLDNLFRIADGNFVYVTTDDGGPSLVVESPRGAEVTALSGIEIPSDALHVSHASTEDWLLLHGDDGAPWYRVEVATGSVDPLDLTPPSGWQWLECHFLQPTIDEAGRVLLPMRNDVAGRVHRLDPVAGVWEPVAAEVTRIDDMSGHPYGQTVVVRSHGQNSTFCPPLMFDPAPDLLEGSLWQIVRPNDGVEYVLSADTSWIGLDAEGTCAVVIDPAIETTTLLDVVEGTELQLPGSYGLVWWKAA